MPVYAGVAIFIVATLYFAWRVYQGARLRREHRVRQRVAYMLWEMAGQEERRPFGTLSGFYRVVGN